MSIKLMAGGSTHDVNITIFPDNTSQVWQLDETVVDAIKSNISYGAIVWDFENEAELFHVCQLAHLLRKEFKVYDISLITNYLPYARQDKKVANDQSFALHTFGRIISLFVDSVSALDPHSTVISEHLELLHFSPENFIDSRYREGYNLLCYPDKGAGERYHLDKEIPFCCLKKVRDQLTGEITGLDLDNIDGSVNPWDIEGKDVLIVDDICDGGRTFIEACKVLKKLRAKTVSLYVTHGIFSKGTKPLFDAGLDRIFTSDGEVKNEDQPILAN